MSSLRIAILGAGDVGGTLGRKWARAGHSVVFGVKNPDSERAQSLRGDLGEHTLIGSPAEALAQGDIVLLAVSGSVVEEFLYLKEKASWCKIRHLFRRRRMLRLSRSVSAWDWQSPGSTRQHW